MRQTAQMCLHMHDPREQHLEVINRILRYIKGTMSHRLQLHSTSLHYMVTYTYADWASCPDTRRSTSGSCVYLGDNLVSWSAKWQHTVSRSSTEAEHRVVANAVAEASLDSPTPP
jgi:hypothetical protein